MGLIGSFNSWFCGNIMSYLLLYEFALFHDVKTAVYYLFCLENKLKSYVKRLMKHNNPSDHRYF